MTDSTTLAESTAPAVRSNGRLLRYLLIMPVVMLLFVFYVLVPMYNLLCNTVGQQLNPNDKAVAFTAGGPTGRFVQVYFEPRVLDGLPIRFTVDDSAQTAEVGVDSSTIFRLQNTSNHIVHLRPIHLVSPQQAAKSFGMKVCFCFNDQTIEAGGVREFPVIYAFGKDMDARVTDVTISYTLLALKNGESEAESTFRANTQTAGQGVIVTPRYAPKSTPIPEAP